MSSHPVIAVIAPGAMGAAVAARLTHAGCTVLTNLDGRSPGTIERAKAAGMQHASFADIVERVDWVLSILPPSDAVALSTTIFEAHKTSSREKSRKLVYVDCNAVNPETAQSIAAQWKDVEGVVMLDAGIIGGPPSAPQDQERKYDPTFYASAQPQDLAVLKEFVTLGKDHNVKIVALEGEGASIGDASALKMSYAGIAKGLTGLITTMLLSAHASSPATADALLNELNQSQPMIIKRLISTVPDMLPKAYRFSGEMEEIAGFVGNGVDPSVGQIYQGVAKLYERVDASLQNGGTGEVEVLKKLVEQAKNL